MRPCPDCGGARLRPESLAVQVGGIGIHELTKMSARRTIEWFQELELSNTERQIARLILREIDERLRFLDNVGVGYLSLDRAAATLSGGEAQRIRLATQIGSSLVGVLYILDEPSIGLHQRDNERLIGTLERLRDLGNTVIVVEHDEGTMRAADYIVDMGPAAGEHGGHVIAEGTPERDHGGGGVGHRPVPRGHARDRGAGQAALAERVHRDRGRDPAQPPQGQREGPARRSLLRHRRVGLGQVDARERGALQGGREQAPSREAAAGRPQARARPRAGRQDHQHRPVADRAHAALEPRDLHRRLRPDPRALLEDAGVAGARLQAGALLVQRQGRPLRGVPRRRPDQDRDALPPGRLRAVRAVRRQALQPRDAGRALQGQVDRRRARHAGRGGGRLLPPHPEDLAARCGRSTTSGSTTSDSGSPPRRSRGARRSVSSSRPSSRRSPPARPSTSSTSPPPAFTSPTSSGCSRCSSGWSTRATPWS